eukprot:5674630-Prymnesium_polylepis.2
MDAMLLVTVLLALLSPSQSKEVVDATSEGFVETPTLLDLAAAHPFGAAERSRSAGDQSVQYSGKASTLRGVLLSGYDSVVPPPGDGVERETNYGATTETATVVEMVIRFIHADSVDAAKGTMRLSVWVTFSWTDSRLAWNPADHGGITFTYFRALAVTDAESTEIWVPPPGFERGLVALVSRLIEGVEPPCG